MSERRGHPGFYQLVERMVALHNAKNADYAADDDPFSNFRMCEAFGVPAWKGTLTRMSDKWARIGQLANGKPPAVKDEAIEDTLLDLAVYALITIVLKREAESGA